VDSRQPKETIQNKLRMVVLSHCLQGFKVLHIPGWCKISSINSTTWMVETLLIVHLNWSRPIVKTRCFSADWFQQKTNVWGDGFFGLKAFFCGPIYANGPKKTKKIKIYLRKKTWISLPFIWAHGRSKWLRFQGPDRYRFDCCTGLNYRREGSFFGKDVLL